MRLPPDVEQFPVRDRASWLELRQADVTASVAGALLGVHEYTTAFALWALKSGRIGEDPEETPAMKRGRLLEPVALALLREERPTWQITPGAAYYRAPADRIGATPDAFAIDPARPGIGVVQVKTTEASAFRRNWRDPETREIEVPLWIAVQAIVEAKLTGASWAVVVLMVVGFGLDLYVVDVPIHDGVYERLRGEVAEFWSRVENDRPYDPDFGRDGRLIASIFAQDNGREIDLSAENDLPEILARREVLKAREAEGRAAEKDRKAIDAELILRLRHAARGRLADGTLIEAPTTRRASYVVDATTFRSVKVRKPIGFARTAPISADFPEKF